PIPSLGAWRLIGSGAVLLAIPEKAGALAFRVRWLTGSLEWQIGPLPEANAWSVDCLDAGTGILVQRLNLDPEALPIRRMADSRPRSLFPLGCLARDAAAAPGPTVVHDRLGLILALGNQVKVLGMDAPSD